LNKADRAKWIASSSDASRVDGERNLVSHAVKGDQHAFGTLYEMHLDAIYRYVYLRVGEAALAEDMTEEVFVKAWEALPGFRPMKSPFTSWLYRIAHNLVVDHYRRESRVGVAAELNPEAQPDLALSPEDILVEQENIAALAAAIKQLSDEEQQVIVLRFVEGMPHLQVAEVIGKSAAASRVIQHRALTALANHLGKGENSDVG
jgi:RNA polymerase sigma-70 factor (ECF subfamily)